MTAVDAKYTEEIMNKIYNPFWKDVLKAFIKTNENIEPEDTLHILKTPIFHNCNICIDKRYFSGKTGSRRELNL